MGDLLSAAISIAFHGLALAMVLYLISVGLSVTMGLMGFINLAHGAFAMAGGYGLTTLMGRFHLPFAPALAGAIIIVVLASLVLERLLYRRLYGGVLGRDDIDPGLTQAEIPDCLENRRRLLPGRRPDSFGVPGFSRLSQLSHPLRRGAGHRPMARPRAHALRGAGPGRRR